MRSFCPSFVLAFLAAISLFPAAGSSAPPERLDAAPFARVVTWDPARMDGARSNRIQEFRAEDLFVETELASDADGNYFAPVGSDGRACIGLQWLERRPFRLLTLDYKAAGRIGRDPSVVSSTPEAEVQCWTGESAWQGNWRAFRGTMTNTEKGFSFTVADDEDMVQKIRWIFLDPGESIIVAKMSAETHTPVEKSSIRLELENPKDAESVEIECYNGFFADGTVKHAWNPSSVTTLDIYHTLLSADTPKTERTVLRFRFPKGGFGVAVNDVLERGPVYLPHVGLYATKVSEDRNLKDYKKSIQSNKKKLEQLREISEQTREQAMAKTHYDLRLDKGKIMLSLACDNDKFIVDREGSITFVEEFTSDENIRKPKYRFAPSYGSRQLLSFSQGWGEPGIDESAHAGKALALRIHDTQYKKGLGHHANGEMVIALGGKYDRFEAEIGLQWQGGNTTGSVVFQALVDGQKKFESKVIREHDDPTPVSISLLGANTLTLKVSDAGDGYACDAADWAEARLISSDKALPPAYITEFLENPSTIKRHLNGGWLPAPVTTIERDGVIYRQRTYVTPFDEATTAPSWWNEKPLCVAEITIENTAERPVNANANLAFLAGDNSPTVEVINRLTRTLILSEGRLLAVVDRSDLPSGTLSASGSLLSLSAEIPAGSKRQIIVYLPAWNTKPEDESQLKDDGALYKRFEQYWRRILDTGMQIDLPDQWLTNVIRANQVHVFMAARNEEKGKLIAPWIASDRYLTAIDSEGNSVIRGMMYWGHFDFARRAFEYYFTKYTPQGFMTTGYTLMGNGWHLWTLGNFVGLSGDVDWLRMNGEKPFRLCQWVRSQIEKTKTGGEKWPEYGLMPPGVEADWNAYAYYFYTNGYYHAGLSAMGEAMKTVGHPDAEDTLKAASALRAEILRAFSETQAQSPVVSLRDGTWVPYYPTSVHTPGPIGDYFPGQDGNRSWAYDVEIGSHHLVPQGVLNPNDPSVDWMMNRMEDVDFLSEGWGGFPAVESEKDWFNRGGFAKVQPYYGRIAEVYAMRDDVKPFLRSYFNTLASLIDGEVLSIYEHFSNWCNNKTHETGYFLHQSRTLLLTERGDDLWLAPFLPSSWLEDGKTVEVKNAPTYFGPMSYRIGSSIAQGRIEATINAPARNLPRAIVLRLRCPGEKPIRSVLVNGQPHEDFDVAKGIIRLKPTEGTMQVRVSY